MIQYMHVGRFPKVMTLVGILEYRIEVRIRWHVRNVTTSKAREKCRKSPSQEDGTVTRTWAAETSRVFRGMLASRSPIIRVDGHLLKRLG
jgi:hypothetical protein